METNQDDVQQLRAELKAKDIEIKTLEKKLNNEIMTNTALQMENQRLERQLTECSPGAIERIEIWND